MSRQSHTVTDVSETARPWDLSRTQWIWVALVLAAVGLVFYSYELLNAAPPPERWPGGCWASCSYTTPRRAFWPDKMFCRQPHLYPLEFRPSG